jgi:hypothetical protein
MVSTAEELEAGVDISVLNRRWYDNTITSRNIQIRYRRKFFRVDEEGSSF